jgi:putative flippase GtrA
MVERYRVGVLTATNLAFILVTVENYLLHYHWSFASDQKHVAAFPRFVLMNVVGFFINWTIMSIGVSTAIAHYLVVQAIAILAVVIWNYLLSRFWIFAAANAAKA